MPKELLSIEVAELIKKEQAHLKLTLIEGKGGLSKKINIPRIQKPGLALIGDTSKLTPGRVQVLGKSEITYLRSLKEEKAKEIVESICEVDVACFIVTRDINPPEYLSQEASKKKIPLFKTPLPTSTFINRLTRFLDDCLTASLTIHGVLMDVFGVGILITGKSGIGKSECALDLILRGHRLVADDIVHVKKRPPSNLYGSSTELLQHHMEIRGLGIINIKDLFGVASIKEEKLIEIVVELVAWNPDYEYDRLGIDDHRYVLLDTPIPYIKIPVSPGRNLTTIIEVAARNNLLKMTGHHSSRIFQQRLDEEILKKGTIED